MASLKLKEIDKARSYDEIQTNVATFVGTLAASDTIQTCQVLKVSERPAEYWGALVIWTDDSA